MKFINLIGQRFGRLIVLSRAENSRFGHVRLTCRCDCGNETTVESMNLSKGSTKSCGCLVRSLAAEMHTTHGVTRNRKQPKVYRTWAGMIQRCTNKSEISYKHYGGRGIAVCRRWLVFENFLSDMGNPPTPNHSIDRINNNGNYEPTNCRWATIAEQLNNTRQNVFINYNGQKKTVTEWARVRGMKFATLRARIKSGWPIEKALFQPIKATQDCWQERQDIRKMQAVR